LARLCVDYPHHVSICRRQKLLSWFTIQAGQLGSVSAAMIEHALLRAPMTKPNSWGMGFVMHRIERIQALVGSDTHVDNTLGSRFLPKIGSNSPLQRFVLRRKEPLITFALNWGMYFFI